MTTLTDFLLARIAEDEKSALAWGSTGPSRHLRGTVPEPYGEPGRVLAECDAKRRIVEDCRDEIGAMGPERIAYEHGCGNYGPSLAESTLRSLATVYASHADYDVSWRP